MFLQRIFPLPLAGAFGGGAGGLTVTLSVSDIYAYNPSAGSTVTTVSTTATASGGTAPYTYAWNSGVHIAPTAPTSATTAFTAVGSGIASDYIELRRCTVTDNVGATAFASCNVEIQSGGNAQTGPPNYAGPIIKQIQ